MTVLRIVTLAILVSLLASPVAAQQTAEPMLEMLEDVPEDALRGRTLLSYVDYRAIEAARPGAARPRSMADLLDLKDAGDPSFDEWLGAFSGIVGGSGKLRQAILTGAEEWPALLGMDFFDTDRELSFGNPPSDGLVLAGTYDPAAISAAYQARGFDSSQGEDWTLICGAAGCDEGLAFDFASREPADPFGGMLGQQQPLLVADDLILNSAAFDTLESMRDAADSTRASLAESAVVRTALGVVPDGVLLRQATLVPPETLIVADGSDGMALEPIPPYRLVSLADTATTDEQVAYLVLVFDSEDEAQVAAKVLPGRIDSFVSSVFGQPLREMLEDRGMTEIDVSIVPGPAGSDAATVLALRAPLASSSPDGGSGTEVPSSLLYRTLVNLVLAGDTLWLSTAPTE